MYPKLGVGTIVLALMLTACQTTKPQLVPSIRAQEPNLVELCGRVLYGAGERDRDRTLACAHALDIWQ